MKGESRMSEGKPKIEIGYRVGKLTVIGKTGKRKNNYMVWSCQCDCGNTIELDTRYLQRGTVTDCGCSGTAKSWMMNLQGKRFGKLVCLEAVPDSEGKINGLWKCQCDCGKTCLATVSQLRSGSKKSCGCLKHPELKDYVGKKFNMLTVIAYAGKWNGMHHWKCRCDCGNETIVGQTVLQTGRTKSCGCLKHYKKEEHSQSASTRGLVEGTCVSTIVARMNKPPISSNTSGYNGVYKNANQRWTAQITFKKKTYYLGSFDNIQDAVAARKKGEAMFENFLDDYYTKHPDNNNDKDAHAE